MDREVKDEALEKRTSFASTVASVFKLKTVAVSLTAQMAYHHGEFAAAAECARCAIKLREEGG